MKRFPYLVAAGFDPPPPDVPASIRTSVPVPDHGPRPISALSRCWAQRLEQQRALKVSTQRDANAIEDAITQAKLDSGASKTFINSRCRMHLTGLSNKVVVTANGTKHPASHTVLLLTLALSKGAREALVIPGMQQKALMSVVWWRDNRGLWMVPIDDAPAISPCIAVTESANSVCELPSTNEVVPFLNAALGYPTKARLLKAAKHGNLVTFPGLTPKNIAKHFPESNKTQKGHMKQTKQGIRSTKVVDEDAMLVFGPSPGVKQKDVYLRAFDATKKQMYTDQTGKFPIMLARGNKFIMVAVELDGNYIDAPPLPAQNAKALTDAYKKIFQRWKATGAVSPNWHILNNEAPEELKQAIRTNGCRVELTPADLHQRNAAERAIQTFKGHFISVLAGVAEGFPINQWDELLPQTILTLNLLRQSNVAPNISAWAYHHGSFDYNRMPIVPMGCEDQFHIKPTQGKFLSQNISRTLQNAHCICQEDKSTKISRHGVFQAQVHHHATSSGKQ
eukprot:CCRYP_020812-RA/>CCRYP_020812-RA protein AED:0.35 eAED:0.35 QI:0/0/0/1/1/1/2/0/506